MSRKFSLIGRNIEFSQTQNFSDGETGRNWQSRSASSLTNYYCGKHDT